MAKTVKLADLAERLNVSTVTVSKALSNQKGVSEELREKIKELADEMGYVQPSTMRKLKQRENFYIGVVISERYIDKYGSFYWQIYQAITMHAGKKSSFTIMEVMSQEDEQNLVLPKMVLEKKIDGIIVVGRMEDAYLKALKADEAIPVMYLDFYDRGYEFDAVISNSYYGSYLLTNYLFSMGHEKIAYVGTLLATESITDRYFGYAKSMMEHGVKIEPEWIIEDRRMDSGKLHGFVDWELPKNCPTAFVCNCDLTASEMIKKLRGMGYSVPEDFSVVGFDNYLYPGLCDIGITTYEVDTSLMAKRAVNNLIKKMSDANYKTGVTIIEGRLVYKDSVKAR